MRASFRFAVELQFFLSPENRRTEFGHDCARAATLKNAIEALGVPHTEVGALRVNGEPATLQRIVREGDVIDVGPWHPDQSVPDPVFLADAHLGGLARFLRMLGFDTAHENAFPDDEIRRIAREERRVVLTRDRELLKCADIALGAYVRELKAEAQLQEVATRFSLAARSRPFTLCLHCNVPLQPISREEAAHQVPGRVAELHRSFTRCPKCGRIFWPGSHFERMNAALRRYVSPGPSA